MDVAYVSQFAGRRRIFRHVDTELRTHFAASGDDPLDATICQQVLDGRLPELLGDTAQLPPGVTPELIRTLGVAAYASVPIRLADGSVYGMFCCYRHSPDTTLGDGELRLMRVMAELVGDFVEREIGIAREVSARRAGVEALLRGNALSTVYQPIHSIASGDLLGLEALSRFDTDPPRTPDLWFNEATSVGLGQQLEIQAIACALQTVVDLPASAYLSCNVSPEVAVSDALHQVLRRVPLSRVVLEITEHASVVDYQGLADALAPLRGLGLRIAVDDAGAGYASFRHILSLNPDMVKLDLSLTRGIDTDPARRALTAAFVGFSRETGCVLVAEGVETAAELHTLREMGVHAAQGYYLGRPAAWPSHFSSGCTR